MRRRYWTEGRYGRLGVDVQKVSEWTELEQVLNEDEGSTEGPTEHLGLLDDLAEVDVAEHVARYQLIHADLQAALSAIDGA